jgi:hypothetical protein
VLTIKVSALTTDLASYRHKFVPMGEPAVPATAAMVDVAGC